MPTISAKDRIAAIQEAIMQKNMQPDPSAPLGDTLSMPIPRRRQVPRGVTVPDITNLL